MSFYEDVSTLFTAAITDGQANEAIVKAAYEDLLGYDDADTMDNAAARVDYWVEKLDAGELTPANFGGSFLEEANTHQGDLISRTIFESNQLAIGALMAAYDNADGAVTLQQLKTVAVKSRGGEVANQDEDAADQRDQGDGNANAGGNNTETQSTGQQFVFDADRQAGTSDSPPGDPVTIDAFDPENDEILLRAKGVEDFSGIDANFLVFAAPGEGKKGGKGNPYEYSVFLDDEAAIGSTDQLAVNLPEPLTAEQAVAVTKLEIEGTAADDTVSGGPRADTFSMLGGDDTITAAEDDVIDGGDGEDEVLFEASVSNNELTDDDLRNVEIVNLKEDPVVDPDEPATKLNGGVFLAAQSEALRINGHAGNDVVKAPAGGGTFRGGFGKDVFIAGPGSDQLIIHTEQTTAEDTRLTNESSSSDFDVVRDFDLASDRIDVVATNVTDFDSERVIGGADTELPNETAPNTQQLLWIDLNADETLLNGIGGDILVYTPGLALDNEQARSVTAFALTGTDADDTLGGADLADELEGGAGADTLTGGAGADTLTGGAGGDEIVADQTDTMDGGADTDTVKFDAAVTAAELVDDDLQNIENVEVTNTGNAAYDFSDQSEALNITGNTGGDTITGSAGNDTITGGAGADTLDGGGGEDTFVFNDGDGVAATGSNAATNIVEFDSGVDITKNYNPLDDILRFDGVDFTDEDFKDFGRISIKSDGKVTLEDDESGNSDVFIATGQFDEGLGLFVISNTPGQSDFLYMETDAGVDLDVTEITSVGVFTTDDPNT